MRRTAGALAAMMLMLAALGCQKPNKGPTQPRIAELPPVPDRLRAFYQELRNGKFEILADFEAAGQAQVFRVEGHGQSQLTVQRSRLATGAGALEVRFDDAGATLLADNEKARDWALPRNWSHHELFMVSIYAPTPVVAMLQIRSGTQQVSAWDSAPLPLTQGWNLVRIDLADIARQVNLEDVRQVRLQVQADAWPFTCYLDDLMLADNTVTAFGNPNGEEGTLYVLKKGRRFHVGVAKRFELVFSRGMLTSWYDLSSDPDKRIDLAGTGPAGPALTALDQTGAPEKAVGIDSWSRLGKSVQTQLQIVEANPLAVTVRGTIHFSAEGADAVENQTAPAGKQGAASPSTSQPAPGTARQTYVYTIRRDGRIFVDIQAQIASDSFRPAGVGLAVTCLHTVLQPKQVDPLDRGLLDAHAARSAPAAAQNTSVAPLVAESAAPQSAGVSNAATTRDAAEGGPASPADRQVAPLVAHPSAPNSTAGTGDRAAAMTSVEVTPLIPRALLLARPQANGTSLLLVPSNVTLYRRVTSAVSHMGDIAAHMYVLNPPSSDKIHLAVMLAVWPPDLRDLPTATAVARDYQQPKPPVVEVGKLRSDNDFDLDGDGFAEGLGRWILEPDGQVLRLRWPAGQLRFWPMLEIAGLKGKACWPYLDGRIIKPVEKRTSGESLFVVPEILSHAALLEVTVEK